MKESDKTNTSFIATHVTLLRVQPFCCGVFRYPENFIRNSMEQSPLQKLIVVQLINSPSYMKPESYPHP